MARLIPGALPPGAPASEYQVFESLRQLGDSWTVLWNVPVGLFGKPTATMRQIDFLLAHEHLGIIVIEVKGGAIKVENGQWWTQPRNSSDWTQLDKSPFDQAADQRYALQRYLTEKLRIDRGVFAHAVAFPATVVTGDLGPDAPRDLILDLEDLRSPATALRQVRAAWGDGPPLRPDQLDKVVAELKPTFTLTVVAAAIAAETTTELERETRRQATMVQSQVDAYRTLLSTNRVLVVGGAGTGKTVIAAQLAEQLSTTGNRTLLLCHRAAVQAFLHTLLAIRPGNRKFDPDSRGLLSVTAWPGLVTAVAEKLEKSPRGARSSALAELFLEYREHDGTLFDAVVIDEGQEFTGEQIEALEWMLTEPEKTPLYVFADPFQHSGLFSTAQLERNKSTIRYRWSLPIEAQLVALNTNCRNSNPIADVAAKFYPYTAPQALVDGPPPQFHQVAPTKVITETLSLARHLIEDDGFQRNQLLIIPIGVSHQDLERAADRAGLHLAAINHIFRFPLTPKDLRIPSGTPDDVQGLEADVTIVAFLHAAETPGTDREIYIAASRARSNLHIVSNLSEAQVVALAAEYAENARESSSLPSKLPDE